MFSTNAVKPSSMTRLATTVTTFFQIPLLSVPAEPSVSTTGVYGPPCLEVDPAPDSQREKLKWSVIEGTLCVYLVG